MAETSTRSPSVGDQPPAVAPAIRSIADYLRASTRGPFGWIAWTKFLVLVAVGFAGAVVMFSNDDMRSLVIGASFMLLGMLGAAAVWILNWVLIAHIAQTDALRALERQLARAAAS